MKKFERQQPDGDDMGAGIARTLLGAIAKVLGVGLLIALLVSIWLLSK